MMHLLLTPHSSLLTPHSFRATENRDEENEDDGGDKE
jgi:hypothetical protein